MEAKLATWGGNLRALRSVGASEACSGHTHPSWYMLTATYCTTCTKITPQSRDSSLLSQLPENRRSVRQVKTARPSSLPHRRRLGPVRRKMKLSVTANVRAIRRKTRALPVQDSWVSLSVSSARNNGLVFCLCRACLCLYFVPTYWLKIGLGFVPWGSGTGDVVSHARPFKSARELCKLNVRGATYKCIAEAVLRRVRSKPAARRNHAGNVQNTTVQVRSFRTPIRLRPS